MHRLIQTLIIAYCSYNSQPHPTTVLSVHYSTAHLLDGLLQVEEAEDSNQSANITCMRAHLDSPLKAGSSIDIELYTVHVGLMTPFPAQASQSDPQRVLLEGSHYVASPYPISKQTTKASFAAAVFGTAIETLVCLNQLCCLCCRATHVVLLDSPVHTQSVRMIPAMYCHLAIVTLCLVLDVVVTSNMYHTCSHHTA